MDLNQSSLSILSLLQEWEPVSGINISVFCSSIDAVLSYAGEGSDYEGSSRNVTFSPSVMTEANVCTNITILQDEVLECEEGFSVNIASTSLPTQIVQSQSNIFITDDGKVQ